MRFLIVIFAFRFTQDILLELAATRRLSKSLPAYLLIG